MRIYTYLPAHVCKCACVRMCMCVCVHPCVHPSVHPYYTDMHIHLCVCVNLSPSIHPYYTDMYIHLCVCVKLVVSKSLILIKRHSQPVDLIGVFLVRLQIEGMQHLATLRYSMTAIHHIRTYVHACI